ncbi:MAG: gliding motility-associated C-terminal domain-containing protein [Cytophagaceae bacterium]|nr:gliding motility-associated C-terminal domain-containing protein [Cytophagaceae bacterium]MDW8456370.1 gliding motility-associated C-terminal domain-containing protein [Cytophagaceae bacterium]
MAYGVFADEQENVYVVGSFGAGTIDFDPQPTQFLKTCQGNTDAYMLKLRTCPRISLIAKTDNQNVSEGQNLILEINLNDGTSPKEYQWLQNDVAIADGNGISGAKTPRLRFDSVRIQHKGNYVCRITDICDVVFNTEAIKIEVTPVIKVFELLTPNHDGKNEVFYIHNIERYPSSSVIVLNRWGNKVYQAAPYKNDWSGDDLPDGVYYYILKIDELNLQKQGGLYISR